MTMVSSFANNDTSIKLRVIEQTYPAWRIRGRGNDMWSATRIVTPTPAQAAAGLHHFVVQPDLDALAAVLCQQLLIAQSAATT